MNPDHFERAILAGNTSASTVQGTGTLFLHLQLKCCGSEDGPEAYVLSTSANGQARINLPQTCCHQASQCADITNLDKFRAAQSHKYVFQQDCSYAIVKFIEDNRIFLIIVFGSIALIQVMLESWYCVRMSFIQCVVVLTPKPMFCC